MKLTIGNSMSRVEGLTDKQLRDLRKLTSYSIDPKAAYFSGSSYNTVRHLMDKKGSFPTGLLYIVEKYLSNKIHTKNDQRMRPKPRQGLFNLSMPHTPYPEQMEAAKVCLAQSRGIISATTGTGKSLMAALIVNALQVPTLIVVPSLELKRQLTETMVACFGKDMVGELGSPLAIENVDALDPKKPLKGYDAVLIDEFHHSGAKTYRQLNQKAWTGVFYKFGLTATPFRSQEHERLLLESVLSRVIYRLDYKTSVEKGYIVPVEAYYVDLPLQATDAFTWQQVYSELVVNNKKRNEIIGGILTDLYFQHKKTLCLVKEIAHGKLIQQSVKAPIPFVYGEDSETYKYIKDFNKGKYDLLEGTAGVLGEGVDTKLAEFVIIAGLGKSRNQFMQQVGRGIRRSPDKESCKVFIFRDPSHKFTLAHFKEQCKILREEYGAKPIKLEI